VVRRRHLSPGDDNGTTARARGEVLSASGHVPWSEPYADDDYMERAIYQAEAGQGITTFRWAESVEDVHAALDNDKANELGAVPILNSWGRDYPQRVWFPDHALDRLVHEDGEVAIPTDR
jgi:hypothetical protein